jgi:hypothetical protein
MARPPKDESLLRMALVGYEQEKQRLEEAIQRVQGMLNGTPATTKPLRQKKRKLSAAGRARIVAALKRRWAAKRKAVKKN